MWQVCFFRGKKGYSQREAHVENHHNFSGGMIWPGFWFMDLVVKATLVEVYVLKMSTGLHHPRYQSNHNLWKMIVFESGKCEVFFRGKYEKSHSQIPTKNVVQVWKMMGFQQFRRDSANMDCFFFVVEKWKVLLHKNHMESVVHV